MKAVRLHQAVGIEGLIYEEAPEPSPAIGGVLVKVHACGITPTELFWPIWTDRSGHERQCIIPGHEFSGVVVGLGHGTAGVAVSDEVYGLIDGYRDRAAAEYIAIEARDVAPKPTTIDHVHAAALPQAGLTSWQALFDHGHLESGQSVLIHGAAGALGSMAIQLACWAGARHRHWPRQCQGDRAGPRRRPLRRSRARGLGRDSGSSGRRVRHDR